MLFGVFRMFGWKGILIALLLIGGLTYGGRMCASDQAPDHRATPTQPAPAEQDELSRFVGFVLDDVQSTFAKQLSGYEPTRLTLFRSAINSACGTASAAVGPFYCPIDRKVYIDLTFYDELRRRFGAPGDFAQAYVIAHEVGHHVQNLLGTMRQFDAQRQRSDERTANALSVKLELQADCYAGVWGFYSQKRGIIDAKDIESGLRAAAAVGDDEITKGRLPPDSFTHGSAEQRARWFRTGLQSGDPRDCNTFNAR
jgi:hypothetical protein